MARSRSAFGLRALQPYAVPEIRARLGPETLVRRFTVLVPVEEVKRGQAPRRIATDDDLLKVQLRLAKDFGGITMSVSIPSLVGWGPRDPRIKSSVSILRCGENQNRWLKVTSGISKKTARATL